MMGYLARKSILWITIENDSCSSCISHVITAMLSIINIISCNTYIDDVDSHTPYFDMFVQTSWYIPEEVRNITTEPIISLEEDSDVILIVEVLNIYFVNWVQYKSSFDIIKCLIWYFAFTIECRCIYTYILKYDVHVMKHLYKCRIYCPCSILINSDECNFILLIPQFCDKKFEDVERGTFASGWKSKGVWTGRTYNHKSRGKSMYAFNIEKRKIHLKYEPRGKIQDINGWIYGDFNCLGQEINRAGLF